MTLWYLIRNSTSIIHNRIVFDEKISYLPSSPPVSLERCRAISKSTNSFTACISSALSDVLNIVKNDSLLNAVSLHCNKYHFIVKTKQIKPYAT